MARGLSKHDAELEAGITTALDIFSGLGNLSARKMFGGAGIYSDGLMFALIADGDIYLKADAVNLGRFIQASCPPYIYHAKNDKILEMSYRRMPDDALDDIDAALIWGRLGFQAAQRAHK